MGSKQTKLEKKCQHCRQYAADVVRKLNKAMVPKEYFLDSDHPCTQLMRIREPTMLYGNKLLSFPSEHILTQYDYAVCLKCYIDLKDQTVPWNYWEQIIW